MNYSITTKPSNLLDMFTLIQLDFIEWEVVMKQISWDKPLQSLLLKAIHKVVQ